MTAELATVDLGARPAMLTPATFKEGWGLAKSIAGTTFVPKGLRGDVNAVFACLLWGMEAGIGPIQSLNGVQVIEGHAAPKPELMRALVLRAGHTLEIRELSDTSCTIAGARKEGTAAVEVTWTMDQARAAQLAGKDVWKKYPRAMLLARATSEVCRAIFSDVIAGLGYVPEERAEIEHVDWVPEGDELVVDAVIVEDRVAADAGPALPPQESTPVGGDDDTPGPNPASDPGVTIADAEVVEPDADGVPAIGAEDEAAPPFGVRETVDPKALADQAMKALGAQHKVELRRWIVENHLPTLAKNMSELQAKAVLARIGEGFS